jgi:hypothetical protein
VFVFAAGDSDDPESAFFASFLDEAEDSSDLPFDE